MVEAEDLRNLCESSVPWTAGLLRYPWFFRRCAHVLQQTAARPDSARCRLARGAGTAPQLFQSLQASGESESAAGPGIGGYAPERVHYKRTVREGSSHPIAVEWGTRA